MCIIRTRSSSIELITLDWGSTLCGNRISQAVYRSSWTWVDYQVWSRYRYIYIVSSFGSCVTIRTWTIHYQDLVVLTDIRITLIVLCDHSFEVYPFYDLKLFLLATTLSVFHYQEVFTSLKTLYLEWCSFSLSCTSLRSAFSIFEEYLPAILWISSLEYILYLSIGFALTSYMGDAILSDQYRCRCDDRCIDYLIDTSVFCIFHSYCVRAYRKVLELIVRTLPSVRAIGLFQSIFVLTWASLSYYLEGTISTIMTAYAGDLICLSLKRCLWSYHNRCRVFSTFSMTCYLMDYRDYIALSCIGLKIHIQLKAGIVMSYSIEQVTYIKRCWCRFYTGLYHILNHIVHTLILTLTELERYLWAGLYGKGCFGLTAILIFYQNRMVARG